ncbi:MAG: hypothetical protein ACKVS6_11760 [Planctomycetota bacterium]
MLYDTRTLAFICELFHPPQQTIDATRIQSIHNELFASPRTGYRNFNFTQGGVVLSNPLANPSANSSFLVSSDRLRLTEELTEVALDDFIARMELVLKLSLQRLEIPIFTACQVSVRSLVNPRQFRDARDYLTKGMFRFSDDDLAPFGRPCQMLGLKLVFPQPAGEKGFYSLRIESWNNDPRSVYMENVGTFTGVVAAAEVASYAECVRATYAFLTDRAVEFLARFDRSV